MAVWVLPHPTHWLISTQVEPVVEEGGGGHDGHDHDDHGHGHGPYEWIGVFELADGEPYTWTADKVGEKYADATMKLNIVELEGFEDGDDYDAAVDAVRASAAETMELNCKTEAHVAETIAAPACTTLVFDQEFYTSIFGIEFGGGHDGHDHGGAAFEWGGLFDLPAGDYTWRAQKVDNAYADPMMKLVVHPATDGTMEALEALEGEAGELMEGACADVEAGGTITPGETCYNLVFDDAAAESTYTVAVAADGYVAFFAEHVPTEFENDMHYLQDAEGTDVEPLVEEGGGGHDGHDHGRRRLDDHDGHDHGASGATHTYAFFAQHVPTEFEENVHYLKDSHGHDIEPLAEPDVEGGGGGGGGGRSGSHRRKRAWRNSMLACLAVLAATTIGALIRYLLGVTGMIGQQDNFLALSGAFACGAILATAFFLIFFESTHLIGARWKVETQATWRFGTMALAGYLVGVVASFFEVGHNLEAFQEKKKVEDETKDEELMKTADVDDGALKADWGFVFAIFFGDFLHNFVDGIFIANAFLDCNQSKGWTIAAATVAHELAQETGDFFLLITKGGLSQCMALLVNALSGVSVFIGAAVFLATKPGYGTQGLLLAFSGGVYVYVAATEAAHTFLHKPLSICMKFGVFICFAIGAVAIGLVLLDHEHCSGNEGGSGDAHAGHNH